MSSKAVSGGSRDRAVRRSVTLLRVFLLASAGILFIGATLLGSVLTNTLRRQALDDTRASLIQYVDGVLRPQLVRGDGITSRRTSRCSSRRSCDGSRTS